MLFDHHYYRFTRISYENIHGFTFNATDVPTRRLAGIFDAGFNALVPPAGPIPIGKFSRAATAS